ncbi:MAG TPA: hypothetical protein VFM18_16100, partial [Methanosarcina sp.]|nr:hypothetical protein [Methanosarcina sp.]
HCHKMMHMIPKSKDEYYMSEMRAYDPSCISLLEFKKDLRLIKKIHRELKGWNEGKEINLRSLLNSFLIIYNQFGDASASLLFYNMDDEIKNLACHFMVRLGRRCELVDQFQLNTNEKLLSELYKI